MTESHDRAIGRIEGKLDLLLEEQGRATENRRKVYRQLEMLRKKQDETSQKITNIESRLGCVEKPIADLNKWRERVMGAAMLVSLTAATVGGSAVVFWQKIITFMKQ